MSQKVWAKALIPFEYATNKAGTVAEFANVGDLIEIEEDMFSQLDIEGFVEGAEAPKVKQPSMRKLPDVDVPENWEELHWNELRALANEITGVTVTTKADAMSAIERYVEAKADDEDEDDS